MECLLRRSLSIIAMLKRFYINNFKSLVDFDIELSAFNCLIGLNGSGKSTLLQAIDYASSLMTGTVNDWLEKRGWDQRDVLTKIVNKRGINVGFEIIIEDEVYRWEGILSRRIGLGKCIRESVTRVSDGLVLFSLKDGHYSIISNNISLFDDYSYDNYPVNFTYEGSVLSQLKPEVLGDIVLKIRNSIASVRSMDLLSPQLLRKRAKKAEDGDVGMGGEHLSAFIHYLSDIQKAQLLRQIQGYYPQVENIRTKALKAGWIRFEIDEKYVDYSGDSKVVVTEARHINDGMLRLLAILALQFSDLETLLFDEIENGINPEITEKVVDALVASHKQVIVTTHSPMVLNYLEDEVARRSVIFLYKRPDGMTRAVRFFEIPSAAEKLKCLAAGDAMLDLFLADMALEAEQMSEPLNA